MAEINTSEIGKIAQNSESLFLLKFQPSQYQIALSYLVSCVVNSFMEKGVTSESIFLTIWTYNVKGQKRENEIHIMFP